ncbi:hypothetical protein BDN67DRAFT_1057203 [Paxillus ammoniavirescens]|nr:hypothetical protein BDN67DRAFT_1057203 [Paxillus ammoniavirescens]
MRMPQRIFDSCADGGCWPLASWLLELVTGVLGGADSRWDHVASSCRVHRGFPGILPGRLWECCFLRRSIDQLRSVKIKMSEKIRNKRALIASTGPTPAPEVKYYRSSYNAYTKIPLHSTIVYSGIVACTTLVRTNGVHAPSLHTPSKNAISWESNRILMQTPGHSSKLQEAPGAVTTTPDEEKAPTSQSQSRRTEGSVSVFLPSSVTSCCFFNVTFWSRWQAAQIQHLTTDESLNYLFVAQGT